MCTVGANSLLLAACSFALDSDHVRQCRSSDECQYRVGLGTCMDHKCVPPNVAGSDTDDSPTSLDETDGSSGGTVTASDPANSTSTLTDSDTESNEVMGASDPESTRGSGDGEAESGGEPSICTLPPPAGSDPDLLIEDLEPAPNASAPDTGILQVDGRRGAWYIASDGTGMQVPSPFTPSPGGAAGTNYSAQLSVTGFSLWGAGFGLSLNATARVANKLCPYDASAFDGLQFWARGSGPWSLQVATVDTLDSFRGGTCEEVCNDAFAESLSLTDEWQFFEIPWESLAQGGWGHPADWDPTELMLLQWSVPESQTDETFVFEVDEIGFFIRDGNASSVSSDDSSFSTSVRGRWVRPWTSDLQE